jgi:4-diphosphocytidyl-2-C-methyl-D-erythritol kinase
VTVMQALSLADELTAAPGGPGVTLTCDHQDLPKGEGNLVMWAAHLFMEAIGRELGVHFTLAKKSPVAAGLGGGSSDAAGALQALNQMAGGPLDAAGLHRLACQLGADVPFFLLGGPAVARGVGDRLTPLALPPYWYLLLNPGRPLSTRWVYENLDLARLLPGPKMEAWDPEHPERWVRNDLETVTLKRFPELADRVARLKRLGAGAAGVSGSGPTVFGLFPGLEAARSAARQIRRHFPDWLAVARGLTGQETSTAWEKDIWMI